MTKHLTMLLLVVLLIASAAIAQEAAPLTGTITFRSGESISGVIKAADLGIMEGTGVGTGLNGYGSIKISADGAKQVIPATSIATIEATWVDKSTPEEPSWEISELRITTADGKTIVGKPDWHMHATNVSVVLPSGETKRVHAFPLGGADFSANNLIAKIELGTAAAAPAATTPAAETPTAPAATPADTPAPTTTPAETTPAPTTPAPTTPAPTETPAPTTAATTETPAPTPTAPTPTTVAAAPTTPTVPVAAVAATVAAQVANVPPGQPMVIKVPIAGTNKVVNILLYVNITEEGIEIMPPE